MPCYGSHGRPGDIPLRKHQREQTVENRSYNPDDDDDDSSSDDEGIGQGPVPPLVRGSV